MVKWADFLISAVRYDEDRSRIVQVRVYDDLGDKVGNARISSRIDVVNSIKQGKTYVTILENQDGSWRKGQEVGIVKMEGEEFIRTDRNSVAKDNLENLPEF